MLSAEQRPDGLTIHTDQDHQLMVITSGEQFGNLDSRFSDPEEVSARRDRLYAIAGLGHVAVISADHGIAIADLCGTAAVAGSYDVDGLITDVSDFGLLLAPADCAGVVLYGTRPIDGRPVAALLHAGWRGANLGIHLAGVNRLEGDHGIARRDLKVFIGPSIRSGSYVYTSLPVELQAPEWQPYVQKQEDGYHIDVLGRILGDFACHEMDVAAQVDASPVDTGADHSGYFSHARSFQSGEAEGRNGILVAISRST